MQKKVEKHCSRQGLKLCKETLGVARLGI